MLALLPLTAIAQRVERPMDITPGEPILQSRFHHGCNGCSFQTRPRSGTLYIIDGVKVETLGPEAKQCTIQAREPIAIAHIDLRMDMNNPSTLKLERKDIMTLPYTDLTDMVSLSPSVHQQQRGAANHISGSRATDVLYVIDGMQVARW